MNEDIKNRILKYKVSRDDFKFKINFEFLKSPIEINFRTKQLDELIVYGLSYNIEQADDYTTIIDFLFELLDGKPVEVYDRVTLKELDHFIRKDPSVPAFKHFSSEHFEIIGIGKKIYNYINDEVKRPFKLYDETVCGEFKQLSLSEQIECFEEFCAYFIYPYAKYRTLELTIDDIDEDVIYLEYTEVYSEKLLLEVQEKFNEEFNTRFLFKGKK